MAQIGGDARAAAEAGDVAALRKLADEHGGDAIRGDEDPGELTTLHFAAAAGNVDAVRFLVSDVVGADVNAARQNNFVPLHAAAMKGRAEICAILHEFGAEPNVQTSPQGYAPLHSAAWGGHGGVVDVLIRAGARTDLLNYRNETPAQTARRQGNTRVADRLEAAAKPH